MNNQQPDSEGWIMKSVLYKMILRYAIEIKRKNMYKKAMALGFTHPKVVSHSQELDILLNKYAKKIV